jgi:hypothetical protein|tara:strand:- start:268 stop:402 length:135 start_codon:yes stop_codon:yes gene_type:complete
MFKLSPGKRISIVHVHNKCITYEEVKRRAGSLSLRAKRKTIKIF